MKVDEATPTTTPDKVDDIAEITARLEAVLREARKDEERLMRTLEMRSLRRRLQAAEAALRAK